MTNQDDSRKPEGQEVVETTVEVPKRPVKRARTAYFVFADELRPEETACWAGVAAIGRALGQLWSTLTDEEKQVYQQKAAAQRDCLFLRTLRSIQHWQAGRRKIFVKIGDARLTSYYLRDSSETLVQRKMSRLRDGRPPGALHARVLRPQPCHIL